MALTAQASGGCLAHQNVEVDFTGIDRVGDRHAWMAEFRAGYIAEASDRLRQSNELTEAINAVLDKQGCNPDQADWAKVEIKLHRYYGSVEGVKMLITSTLSTLITIVQSGPSLGAIRSGYSSEKNKVILQFVGPSEEQSLGMVVQPETENPVDLEEPESLSDEELAENYDKVLDELVDVYQLGFASVLKQE